MSREWEICGITAPRAALHGDGPGWRIFAVAQHKLGLKMGRKIVSMAVPPCESRLQEKPTRQHMQGHWEHIPFPFPTSPPTLPGPACASFPSGKRGQCGFLGSNQRMAGNSP